MLSQLGRGSVKMSEERWQQPPLATSISQESLTSQGSPAKKPSYLQQEPLSHIHSGLSPTPSFSGLLTSSPNDSSTPGTSTKKRFFAARLGLEEQHHAHWEQPTATSFASNVINSTDNASSGQQNLVSFLQTHQDLPALGSLSSRSGFNTLQSRCEESHGEAVSGFFGSPLHRMDSSLTPSFQEERSNFLETGSFPLLAMPLSLTGQELLSLPPVWGVPDTSQAGESFDIKPYLNPTPLRLADPPFSECPPPETDPHLKEERQSGEKQSASFLQGSESKHEACKVLPASTKVEPLSVPGHDVTKWAGLGWVLWQKGITVGVERLLNSRDLASSTADNEVLAFDDPAKQQGLTQGLSYQPPFSDSSSGRLLASGQPAQPTSTGGVRRENIPWTSGSGGAHGLQNRYPSYLQDEAALPAQASLANRLAATLETIQTDGPARKIQRTSGSSMLQPGHHMGAGIEFPGMDKSIVSTMDSGRMQQDLQQMLLFLRQDKTSLFQAMQAQHAAHLVPHTTGDLPSTVNAVAQGLLSSPTFPQTVAVSKKDAIRGILLRAAEASERRDMAAFQALTRQLKPHCKRRGKGVERTVYVALQGLKHRMEGTAGSVVKRRLHITIQEMEKIRAWYYKAMPVCAFSVITSLSILISKLRGHPHVHIVNFGEALIPQLPHLITLLVKQAANEATQASNVPPPALKSIRVTHVRALGLARPGRTEFETLQAPEALAAIARQVAVSLGVEFSFHGIILKDHSLRLLDEIQARPGEVVAVCSISELKFFSDDLGDFGDGLCKMMTFVQRLRPAVVCMIEEDVDACGPEFMHRFANIVDFLALAHECHDALVASSSPKLLHGFEDYYWNLIAFNIIGCEGPERRWRLRSFAQLSQVFRSFGFRLCSIEQSIIDTAQDVLSFYPDGWGIWCTQGRVNITWQGEVAHAASVWSLQ